MAQLGHAWPYDVYGTYCSGSVTDSIIETVSPSKHYALFAVRYKQAIAFALRQAVQQHYAE